MRTLFISDIKTFANFFRRAGDKDKKQRKKRIVVGTLAGLGTLAVAGLALKNHINSKQVDESIKKAYDNLQPIQNTTAKAEETAKPLVNNLAKDIDERIAKGRKPTENYAAEHQAKMRRIDRQVQARQKLAVAKAGSKNETPIAIPNLASEKTQRIQARAAMRNETIKNDPELLDLIKQQKQARRKAAKNSEANVDLEISAGKLNKRTSKAHRGAAQNFWHKRDKAYRKEVGQKVGEMKRTHKQAKQEIAKLNKQIKIKVNQLRKEGKFMFMGNIVDV